MKPPKLSLDAIKHMRIKTLKDIESLLAKSKADEGQIRSSLYHAMPKCIEKLGYDDEIDIVDLLLNAGKVAFDIRYNDRRSGLSTATQVKLAFEALRKAWGNCIRVRYVPIANGTRVTISYPKLI